MATEYVSFFVRVPPELHDQVTELAKERGQSLSELFRRALQDMVDRSGLIPEKKGDERLATIGEVRQLIAEEVKKQLEKINK